MRKFIFVLAATALLAMAGAAPARADVTVFATGVDPVNYNITTWSIRTDYAGTWKGKTPTYFMFDPTWTTRYKNTSGVQYTQSLTGSAVVTDVFSQADLQAVATAGPGWATMGGPASPISFWNHGGQFLHTSGTSDSSWADDTYWASNEYGSVSEKPSIVVTEYTGTFLWDPAAWHPTEGKILADDKAEVYINGTLVHTTDTCAYDQVETFLYAGPVVAGSNNLKVVVYDTGQPGGPTAGATAMQLELNGIIPEPGALSLIGLGLVGLARRKRRS